MYREHKMDDPIVAMVLLWPSPKGSYFFHAYDIILLLFSEWNFGPKQSTNVEKIKVSCDDNDSII